MKIDQDLEIIRETAMICKEKSNMPITDYIIEECVNTETKQTIVLEIRKWQTQVSGGYTQIGETIILNPPETITKTKVETVTIFNKDNMNITNDYACRSNDKGNIICPIKYR